jgi:SAM-dependent methyltransferase
MTKEQLAEQSLSSSETDNISSSTIFWNPSNMLFPIGNSKWRIFQPTYRRNIIISSSALPLIDKLSGTTSSGVQLKYLCNSLTFDVSYVDATKYNLFENTLLNSDMFDHTLINNQSLEICNSNEFIKILLEMGFLSSTWPINYNLKKEGFADRFKGNFYEQIATECLLNREDISKWWVKQKFEDNGTKIKPTPYKYIEDTFLTKYFSNEFKGKSVLEIGCGTGYYTNKIAQYARDAVGLDYNEGYISKAKTIWNNSGDSNAKYIVADIINLESNSELELSKKYDVIILIDTFLFLFDSNFQKELYENRLQVLNNISSLLSVNGKIVIMDPHPLYLSPMIGDPNKPLAILDSYKSRHFKVTPSVSEITNLFFQTDLRILRILEPKIDEKYRSVDIKAYNFYNEFPAWWLIELERKQT